MASDGSVLRNAGRLEMLEEDREGNFLVNNIQTGNTCLVADTFAEMFHHNVIVGSGRNQSPLFL